MTFALYNLALALWVGGIALFSFIVTPAIFRSYKRDIAGDMVGKLFPGYFHYNLVLSALAVILFFLLTADSPIRASRLSLILLSISLLINIFIVLSLHPKMVKARQEIISFEREAPDSEARTKFRRLHALSAGLNLFLLADGIALLITGSLFKR